MTSEATISLTPLLKTTMSPATDTIHDHLSDLYREYRQTKDILSKAIYFSPQCRQICRTNSSYAAKDRETIIKYLLEAGPVIEDIYRRQGWLDGKPRGPPRSFYSVRPLNETEMGDFATTEELEPAGFESVEEVKKKAKDENWEGLRVDMWTDDGDKRGILVKVQYWWRREPLGSKAGTWKQILHDILYLGPRDGSENDTIGDIIEEK